MEDSIQQLLRRDPCTVELGQVLTPPAPSPHDKSGQAARVVQLQLVPSGRTVEARVANLGQGLGRGVFAPPAAGDEVLVLLPGGDPNRAVVLGGLGNATAPNPTSNLGLNILLLHPGGVELRSADGLPAHGIVMGGLLGDLASWVAALEAFMLTASTATTAPQIATAAVTFMSAVGQMGPAPSPFSANLTASDAGGTGGPPYASATNKVTS